MRPQCVVGPFRRSLEVHSDASGCWHGHRWTNSAPSEQLLAVADIGYRLLTAPLERAAAMWWGPDGRKATGPRPLDPRKVGRPAAGCPKHIVGAPCTSSNDPHAGVHSTTCLKFLHMLGGTLWAPQPRQCAHLGDLKIVHVYCGAIAGGDRNLGAAPVPRQAAIRSLQLHQPHGATVGRPAMRHVH